jgi:hypothetical protein
LPARDGAPITDVSGLLATLDECSAHRRFAETLFAETRLVTAKFAENDLEFW